MSAKCGIITWSGAANAETIAAALELLVPGASIKVVLVSADEDVTPLTRMLALRQIGCSEREIARRLGMTPGAVHGKLYRYDTRTT